MITFLKDKKIIFIIVAIIFVIILSFFYSVFFLSRDPMLEVEIVNYQEVDCFSENTLFNWIDTDKKCCEGLIGVNPSKMPFDMAEKQVGSTDDWDFIKKGVDDNNCVFIGRVQHSSGNAVCVHCGNSKCEGVENRCNCPEDCN